MSTVPAEVSTAKLDREIEHWQENRELYRRRGWVLVSRDGLIVDVAFTAQVQVSTSAAPLPIVTACIRLDYSDYDLEPPSLTFIDLQSGKPHFPHVQALILTEEGPRDLLIRAHPQTKLPFLCIPGTREYHSHPQHSGDSWLLHRSRRAGALAVICDQVWRSMARNVFGFRVTVQTFPPPFSSPPDVRLWQGDVDALRAQVAGALPPGLSVPTRRAVTGAKWNDRPWPRRSLQGERVQGRHLGPGQDS